MFVWVCITVSPGLTLFHHISISAISFTLFSNSGWSFTSHRHFNNASKQILKKVNNMLKHMFVQKHKFCDDTRGLLCKSLTPNNDVSQIPINRCYSNTNSFKFGCYFNLYFIFAVFLLLPFWNNVFE